MAGKRHHYIPRFLQRGFLTGLPKKEFTHVYLKGGEQRTIKIDKVGVEGYFYSVDREAELDDIFTDLEGIYASAISILRTNPQGDINKSILAEIISHLEVRTNNLRKSFHSSSEGFLNKMIDSFTSVDVIKPLIKNEISKNINSGGILGNLFDNMKVPIQYREMLSEQILPLVNANLDQNLNVYMERIKESFNLEISKRLKNVIKQGHINGMLKHVAENSKVDIYKGLNYKVIKTDFDVILGDSIIVFEFEDCEEFKPFYDVKNTLKAIYFPIETNIFIYASKDDSEAKLKILNEMIAKCSKDFFIASKSSEHLTELQRSIGNNCDLLTDSEIQQILDDVIQEQVAKFSV